MFYVFTFFIFYIYGADLVLFKQHGDGVEVAQYWLVLGQVGLGFAQPVQQRLQSVRHTARRQQRLVQLRLPTTSTVSVVHGSLG